MENKREIKFRFYDPEKKILGCGDTIKNAILAVYWP